MKSFTADQIFITSWEKMTVPALAMVIKAKSMLRGRALQVALLQAICLKPKIYAALNAAQLYDLLPLIEFLNNPCTIFIKKSFKIGNETYYAPGNLLSNFRMIELLKADFYLHEFFRTENELYLNKLIAVLYRPAHPDWEDKKHLDEFRLDIRRPFASDMVEKHAKLISGISQELKYAIMFSYVACFNKIADANPDLFPKADESGSSSGESRSHIYINILFDLGETTFYAGEKAAKQAYIHDALPFLNKKAKQAKPTT